MIPTYLTAVLADADPGSDEFLSAIEWLVDREMWAACDWWLDRREVEWRVTGRGVRVG